MTISDVKKTLKHHIKQHLHNKSFPKEVKRFEIEDHIPFDHTDKYEISIKYTGDLDPKKPAKDRDCVMQVSRDDPNPKPAQLVKFYEYLTSITASIIHK